MRRPSLAAWTACLAGVLTLTGCSRQSNTPPVPPAAKAVESTAWKPSEPLQSQTQAEAEPGIAKFVLDNLGDLRSGLTLAEWSKLHAGETTEVYKKDTETEGVLDWCARTSFERPLDSDRTLRLTAYFYLPDPPETITGPPDVSPDRLALEPTRRVAALFVADQLFELSGPVFDKSNAHPAIRRRLEAEGATFRWAELGGSYEYTHSWLREALRLDPDGRVGQLAFLARMEQGFDTSGTCASAGFRAVVREGADYLRRRPDTAIRDEIHVMMAQAWGDIVEIGSGGYKDDSDRYAPEVSSARANAIKEYQLAFAFASSSP